MRVASAEISAAACDGDVPSRSRPMTLCLYIIPRPCFSGGVKTSGSQTSAGVAFDDAPRRGNSNPAGITPTTVYGLRSRTIADRVANGRQSAASRARG